MLKYINDPKSDMHRDMAKQIFKITEGEMIPHDFKVLRQAAKNGFVFPEFYGDYYGNCAVNMACKWLQLPQGKWKAEDGIVYGAWPIGAHLVGKGIKSLKQFEEHLKEIETDFWEKRFEEYAEWKKRWWAVYLKYGYIDLLTGFRCYGQMSRNDCTNYPIQGSAFHCNLWALIQLDKTLKGKDFDSRIIGQIHDSIIIDVNPLELADIREIAQQITCQDLPKAWSWIIVPLEVEMEASPVNASWAEKTKIN
jgi:DNA polymerase I-like protein with 3'-5' exonuclease and polymerase domains